MKDKIQISREQARDMLEILVMQMSSDKMHESILKSHVSKWEDLGYIKKTKLEEAKEFFNNLINIKEIKYISEEEYSYFHNIILEEIRNEKESQSEENR